MPSTDVDASSQPGAALPFTTTSELAYVYRGRSGTPDVKSAAHGNYPPPTHLFRTSRRKYGSQDSIDVGSNAGATSLYNLAHTQADLSQLSFESTASSFSTSSTTSASLFGSVTQSLPKLFRRQDSDGGQQTRVLARSGSLLRRGGQAQDKSAARYSGESAEIEALRDESDVESLMSRHKLKKCATTEHLLSKFDGSFCRATPMLRKAFANDQSELCKARIAHQRSVTSLAGHVSESWSHRQDVVESKTAPHTRDRQHAHLPMPITSGRQPAEVGVKHRLAASLAETTPRHELRTVQSMSVIRRVATRAIATVNHNRCPSSSVVSGHGNLERKAKPAGLRAEHKPVWTDKHCKTKASVSRNDTQWTTCDASQCWDATGTSMSTKSFSAHRLVPRDEVSIASRLRSGMSASRDDAVHAEFFVAAAGSSQSESQSSASSGQDNSGAQAEHPPRASKGRHKRNCARYRSRKDNPTLPNTERPACDCRQPAVSDSHWTRTPDVARSRAEARIPQNGATATRWYEPASPQPFADGVTPEATQTQFSSSAVPHAGHGAASLQPHLPCRRSLRRSPSSHRHRQLSSDGVLRHVLVTPAT